MTAAEVCDLLNETFSEQDIDVEVSASMSADDFCDEVNGAFSLAGVECSLAPTMTNTELVSALDAALEELDDAPWDDENDNIVRFLHISDMHGDNSAIAQCETLLASGDYEHLFVTGDRTAYGGTDETYGNPSPQSQMYSSMGRLKGDMLIVAGNHDVCDNSHNGAGYTQEQEKIWQKNYLDNIVNWGDKNGHGCYWYKDLTSGGKTIRIIALDQYEGGTNSLNGGSAKSRVGYSQSQINWLGKLLLNKVSVNGADTDITPADYLMIVMHEPPCQTANVATRNMTTPDATAQCVRPIQSNKDTTRLFVSERHYQWHNVQVKKNGLSDCGINLLPKIMRAYLHGESINFSHANALEYAGTINVVMDFTNNTPAKFIGYVCGHMHNDYVGYIPDTEIPKDADASYLEGWSCGWKDGKGWGDQLVLSIAASSSSIHWSGSDDLLWNYGSDGESGEQYATNGRTETDEPKYRINRYTVNLTRNKVKVERIGNGTTALYNSTNGSARAYGGRKRGVGDNSMTISFNKKIK